jgi:heme-degrading monooxygenase HmoA
VRAAWHVVLAPVSYRGDAVLAGGPAPSPRSPRAQGGRRGRRHHPRRPRQGRRAHREFFERFVALGASVRDAPGHRAALVQAPVDGAVLTFSAWDSLRDAVTWAYHRPEHAATVARQEEHALLASTGFLRCAVLAAAARCSAPTRSPGAPAPPSSSRRPHDRRPDHRVRPGLARRRRGRAPAPAEVAWAPDAVYCDPLDRLEGAEALGRHIGATQTPSPEGGSP